MGVFEHFPYTNFHDMNLDWMLGALKELEHNVNDFVSLNAIKYADPLQWDITKQYEKNTIVIDPKTGTAYISVREVPTGTNLQRSEYWTVVFDLEKFYNDFKASITKDNGIADNLTFDVLKDELFWYKNIIRIAKVDITAGATPTDQNSSVITVESWVNSLISTLRTYTVSLVDAEEKARISAVSALDAAYKAGDMELQTQVSANHDDINTEIVDREAEITRLDGELEAEITRLDGELEAERTLRANEDTILEQKIDNIKPNAYVNVKDFGAVGDALYFDKLTNKYWKDAKFTTEPTNDADAVDRAVQYAIDNNINTVFFPDGAYYLPNKRYIIDTGKLRFLGENETKLVSAGLVSNDIFITLTSSLDLRLYDYARMPLENITIAGNYFTDRAESGVIGVGYGAFVQPETSLISPHISINNVTIEYFAIGVFLGCAYKTVAYNLNIIACNLAVFVPATLSPAVPWNVYCLHIECCNYGFYCIGGGYNSINVFGGAIEYCRSAYTGETKITFYGVRFESDLLSSCNPNNAIRPYFVVNGEASPYAKFIGCNFLFLGNYESNVQYWIANPYKATAFNKSALYGQASGFTGKAILYFDQCEFALDVGQFEPGSYFVSATAVRASANNLIGTTLTRDNMFNPSQLIADNNGLL